MASLAQSSLQYLKEQLVMCDNRLSLLREMRIELQQQINSAESAIRVADSHNLKSARESFGLDMP
jgi:hypothetical protein